MILNRQPFIAFLAVLASILMVIGAFSAVITEDKINSFLTGKSLFQDGISTENPLITNQPSKNKIDETPNFLEETSQPSPVEKSGTPEAISTNIIAIETKMAESPECIIRKGWEIYITGEDDTLEQLAQSRGVTSAIIQVGNCLVGSSLTPGDILYLPPLEGKIVPTSSSSPIILMSTADLANTITPTPSPGYCPPQSTCQPACTPPSGWVPYFLVAGDSIPILSQRYSVSIFALQTANCLTPPLTIGEGDLIYIPGATSTPTIEKTPQLQTPILATIQP